MAVIQVGQDWRKSCLRAPAVSKAAQAPSGISRLRPFRSLWTKTLSPIGWWKEKDACVTKTVTRLARFLPLPSCTRQVLPRFRVEAIFDDTAYSERLDSRNKQPSSRTLNERSKSWRRNSGIRSSLDVGLSINAVSANTRTRKTLSLNISNSYTGTTNPRTQLRYSAQPVSLP